MIDSVSGPVSVFAILCAAKSIYAAIKAISSPFYPMCCRLIVIAVAIGKGRLLDT